MGPIPDMTSLTLVYLPISWGEKGNSDLADPVVSFQTGGPGASQSGPVLRFGTTGGVGIVFVKCCFLHMAETILLG